MIGLPVSGHLVCITLPGRCQVGVGQLAGFLHQEPKAGVLIPEPQEGVVESRALTPWIISDILRSYPVSISYFYLQFLLSPSISCLYLLFLSPSISNSLIFKPPSLITGHASDDQVTAADDLTEIDGRLFRDLFALCMATS